MAAYNDQYVNGLYQKYLGRQASGPEMDYLLKNADSIGPVDLESIIAGHPEAQNNTLQAQGKQFGGALGSNDQQILDKAGQSILGQFAANGRDAGSSGMGNSLLQVGQNLAMDRNSALANFYGQGYQGINSNIAGSRAGSIGQIYGNQNAARDYNYSNQLYDKQHNDYNAYFNSMNRMNKNQAIGQLVGGGLGAALGSFGGVGGARVGAGVGTSLGGLFQ